MPGLIGEEHSVRISLHSHRKFWNDTVQYMRYILCAKASPVTVYGICVAVYTIICATHGQHREVNREI